MGEQWVSHSTIGEEVIIRRAQAYVLNLRAVRNLNGDLLSHRVFLWLPPGEWGSGGPAQGAVISPLVGPHRPEAVRQAGHVMMTGELTSFVGVWSRLPRVDPTIPISDLQIADLASHILSIGRLAA